MKKILTSLALTALAFTGVASAAQTLTFEGFPSESVFTTQYPGINFQGATVLTLGVSLNSAFPPHSGINVVYNPVGPMELLFSSPIDYFQGYFTYNAGLTLEGFDAGNTLLDSTVGAFSANYDGSGNPSNELIRIDAPGIVRVLITGGSGNNFILDDAEFTGSVDIGRVPEPSTMAMLVGALGAFALRRRMAR